MNIGTLSYYINALNNFIKLQNNLHIKKEDLVDHQNRHLRRLVKYAYDYVPLYRRKFESANVKPDQIKTIQDLSKLPCITKSEIRQNVGDAISQNYDPSKLRVLSTSGSTGQPLKVYITNEEDSFRKAKHLRANLACGHKPFDKWLTVTSPSHFSEVGGIQKTLKFYSPKFVSVFWDTKDQLSAIEKFKPTVLDGYSSSLAILAREIKKSTNIKINPKIIFGGAELCDEASRNVIEEEFRAPFYDQYATIEFERMAWQCPAKEGYHIDADSLIMQFLDANNEDVSPGESGQIVCTSLFNYAMPLIKYVVGDYGVSSNEECSCGRTLPLMSKIEGRSDSILVLPNGQALSPRTITITMGRFSLNKYIEQYKVIQTRKDTIEIRLKMEKTNEADKLIKDGTMEMKIIEHYTTTLGIAPDEIKFKVNFVNDIPINKNGKLKIVESQIQ